MRIAAFWRTSLVFLVVWVPSSLEAKEPWLEPYVPTKVEWVVIELQAAEGDPDLGDDGMTVHFFLASKSFSRGVVYCDLAYVPTTTSWFVSAREAAIRRRFEKRRTIPGWEWLKLELAVKKSP